MDTALGHYGGLSEAGGTVPPAWSWCAAEGPPGKRVPCAGPEFAARCPEAGGKQGRGWPARVKHVHTLLCTWPSGEWAEARVGRPQQGRAPGRAEDPGASGDAEKVLGPGTVALGVG